MFSAIRKREGDILKERVKKKYLLQARILFNVIQGIDHLASNYFVNSKVMGVRRCERKDLRRVAKATGGTLMVGC